MFDSWNKILFGSFFRLGKPDRPSTPNPPAPAPAPPSRIVSIPTEILQEIFLFVLHSYASSDEHRPCHFHRSAPRSEASIQPPITMVLSHVCRHWRRVALDYPPLWSLLTTADFCHLSWIRTILLLRRSRSRSRLHAEHNPMTIRFRGCAGQSPFRVEDQFELMTTLLVQSSEKAKITRLLVEMGNDRMLDMFDETRSKTNGWMENLEELEISRGRLCTVNGGNETWDVGEAESIEAYISRIDTQHVPRLPFSSKPPLLCRDLLGRQRLPNLRRLSLSHCAINLYDFYLFPRLEDLSVMLASPSLSSCSIEYWEKVINALPQLKRLSLDGAVCPIFVHHKSKKLRNLTGIFPRQRLDQLKINRCAAGAANLLYLFLSQPKYLQITCMTLASDNESVVLCEALGMWLKSWEGCAGSRYLFVSVQPNGIIAHNRRVSRDGSMDGYTGRFEEEEDEVPELQLTLYWKQANDYLCFISTFLMLISTTESSSSPPTSPALRPISSSLLTRNCRELELSIGLFDLESEEFQRVLRPFLRCFDKVKSLRCVGGMTWAALLATLTASDEHDGEVLFPILDSFCFDHVDFASGGRTTEENEFENWFRQRPTLVSNVELVKCRNVRRELIRTLEERGTIVIVGDGTLFDDRRERKREEREAWTSDQVKLLMKKWADDSRMEA